jgi:cytochrome c oxidase assembly protein subunit 15
MDFQYPSTGLQYSSNTRRIVWLKRLAFIALVLTFAVILKGAYTRLVDAGLGCPDWPGCYGFLSVPTEAHEIALAAARYPDAPVEVHKGWPEMIHRYMATTLGLCILGIAALAWRQPAGSRSLRKHSLALLGLVMVQGLFGMWTVTLKLWPQVVTAHLLGGFATFILLALLCIRLSVKAAVVPAEVKNQASGMLWLPLAAVVILVGQISIGGWVTSNYAALACTDLPTCQGHWWPEMDFREGFNVSQTVGPNYLGGQLHNDARVAIHMVHRLGALAVLFVIAAMLVRLWRLPKMLGLQPWLLVTGGLLFIQLSLGIANVLALLPLGVAVAHNGVAALLLLSVVWIAFKIKTVKELTT